MGFRVWAALTSCKSIFIVVIAGVGLSIVADMDGATFFEKGLRMGPDAHELQGCSLSVHGGRAQG